MNIFPSFREFTAPLRHILPIHNVTKTATIYSWISAGRSNLRWEIVWRNAPRIWRDFGSALLFQTRLTQTKSVLSLLKEHGSQVKDQGRRQCCHNKPKNFPIGLNVMYLYFPDMLHILKTVKIKININQLNTQFLPYKEHATSPLLRSNS